MAMDSRQLALLQLCFDESELSPAAEEDFDATAFVMEKASQQVPLETLVADLKTYGADIDGRVIKLVHEDIHEAFIAISGQLVATEAQLHKVVSPLNDMKSRLGHAQDMLLQRRREVERLLHDAYAFEQKRQFHCTVLELTLIHKTLSALMQQCQPAGFGPQMVPVLQRAATEIQRMKQAARELVIPEFISETEAAKFAEDQKVQRQIVGEDVEQYGAALNGALLHACQQYVKTKSDEAAESVSILLDVYRRLGEEQRCLVAFRDNLVRPIAEDVVSWRNAAAARQNDQSIDFIFRTLCVSLKDSVLPLLPLFRRSFRDQISFLTVAAWPAVSDTVLKRMLFLFQAGIPAAFHHSFKAAHEVVRLLESTCNTMGELQSFRNSPDMSIWMRKWNIDVYHTLRQGEFLNRIGQIINAPFVRSAAPSQFVFAKFTNLLSAICDYLSPSTVLFPLVPRFTKDIIAAVTSMATHLVEHISQSEMDCSMVLAIVADLRALQRLLSENLPELLSVALERSSSPLMIQPIIQLVENVCMKGAADAEGALSMHLSDECLASLSNLHSIKATYSMTRKPVPTSASWFMSNVFEPLQSFRKQAADSRQPEAAVRGIIIRVIEVLTQKLRTLTKEVIISARKAQESLEKLRRKKEGAGSGTLPVTSTGRPSLSDLTDRDKMVVQLYLDVREYSAQLKRFGIDPESYEPLKSVMRLVRRANWILGEDVPEPHEVEEDE